MAWHDLITDPLVRYYWLEKWYGECKGIVEYLSEWARDYCSPTDVKALGILATIVIALLIGWYGAEFMRKPKK